MAAPPRQAPAGSALAALALSPLLAGLSRREIEAVLASAEPLEVAQGALFLREGDESRDMYFVLEGQACVRRNYLTLATLGPGGHFGALGLFSGRPRSASIAALTPLKL